jgi:hypothetical protein
MWYLASLLLFAFLIARIIRRGKKDGVKTQKDFWERERAANLVPRQSIEDLPYIKLPLSTLPIKIMEEDAKVGECVELLTSLKSQRILNLTGMTNTDIKLKYGAPNMLILSQYDENYTLLVRTLHRWANLLDEGGYTQDARVIWEYAISIGTDVKGTYVRLFQIYQAMGEAEEIKQLVRHAKELPEPSKSAILRKIDITPSEDPPL